MQSYTHSTETLTSRRVSSAYSHRQRLNAALGVVGIFVVGVFLDWFTMVVLHFDVPGRIAHQIFNSTWQVVTTVAVPCVWAVTRLDLRWSDLGLRREGLIKNVLLGCGLYSIALLAFIHCSDDPMISHHAVRYADPAYAAAILASMSMVAASTDIVTRGFILLTLQRYTYVWLAVVIQNVAWIVGHIGEISMLRDCLGLSGAVALTITLGVLGDIIALRTRNVVGLAAAHVLLNVTLVTYIRHM